MLRPVHFCNRDPRVWAEASPPWAVAVAVAQAEVEEVPPSHQGGHPAGAWEVDLTLISRTRLATVCLLTSVALLLGKVGTASLALKTPVWPVWRRA